MKKLFCLVLISILGCKSNNAINHYLNQDSKGRNTVIVDRKVDSKQTLAAIYNNIKFKTHLKSNIALKRLKNTLSKNQKGIFWSVADFKLQNLTVIKNGAAFFGNKKAEIDKGNRLFYSFSNAEKLGDDKAFFFVNLSNGWTVIFDGITVMQKQKGGWKLVDKIESRTLH